MVQPYGNDRSWPIIIRYPTVRPGLISDATLLLLSECFRRDATRRSDSSQLYLFGQAAQGAERLSANFNNIIEGRN
jgi:hypothetical protein